MSVYVVTGVSRGIGVSLPCAILLRVLFKPA